MYFQPKKDNSSKKELEKSIKEVKEFNSKWETTFESYKIDESEVKKALSLCETYFSEIDQYKITLDRYIFSNKQMKFKNNECISETIGDVELQIVGKLADLSKLSSINLKSIDSNFSRSTYIGMDLLSDDKLFICVIDNDVLRLCIFDLDKRKVEVKNQMFLTEIQDISVSKSIKCACFNKDILVSVSIEDKNSKIAKSMYYLLNSDNLNLQKKLTIDVITIDISMNSEYVCIFARENGSSERVRTDMPEYYNILGEFYSFNIYDHNLNFVKRNCIGNHEIARGISSVKLNDNYIFLFSETTKVIIININDGSLVTGYNLDGTPFSLYNQNYMLTFNQSSKVLNLYDFEGKRTF